MKDNPYKKQVEVGAKFLEKRLGKFWHMNINLNRLDLKKGEFNREAKEEDNYYTGCILCQIHANLSQTIGNYTISRNFFDIGYAQQFDLGLAIDTSLIEDGTRSAFYELLTKAWKEKIIELRNS